jgi:hypothetical protein
MTIAASTVALKANRGGHWNGLPRIWEIFGNRRPLAEDEILAPRAAGHFQIRSAMA